MADRSRGAYRAIGDTSATLEAGKRWIRERRGTFSVRSEAPRLEHATWGGRKDNRAILEEGRAAIRRQKETAAQDGATIHAMRRELEEEERKVEALLARFAQDERNAEVMRRIPTSDRLALEAVAVHEAGHAVVGWVEGCGVERVWIDIRNRAISPQVAGGRYRPRRATTARCSMAGQEAERIAGLDHVLPEDGLTGDVANVKRKSFGDRESERRAARKILRRNWPAVRALARRLMLYGDVDGGEAERIIHKAQQEAA